MISSARYEPWQKRLTVPNYRVGEAARYAGVSAQTVTHWQSEGGAGAIISHRDDGVSLSYMQLIELAVVAAFKRSGVKLNAIRQAREYLHRSFGIEYPFADYKFKTDGKNLLMDYNQLDKGDTDTKLIELNKSGQFAWSEIIASRLKEFDYDPSKGFVTRWHVAGASSPIIIDPRISFGAPTVKGTPTWVLRDRWIAQESVPEIADDYGLTEEYVRQALHFEGVSAGEVGGWVH